MMCETCVEDGTISSELYEIIEAFLDQHPDQEFSPGHIAIADCNVTDEDLQWCLNNSADRGPWRGFLLWMLTIPESERVNIGSAA